MKIYKVLLLLFITVAITAGSALSQKQVADKIVAIVNDRIILKSDVDNEIRQYMQQAQLENQQISFS
jgi:peptidyl-prolyl cis-trans isomerase SurA